MNLSFFQEKGRSNARRSVNWAGRTAVLLLLLVVAFVALGATNVEDLTNAQQALPALAQGQLQETVAVIVQNTGQTRDAGWVSLDPPVERADTVGSAMVAAIVAVVLWGGAGIRLHIDYLAQNAHPLSSAGGRRGLHGLK